MKYIRLGSFEEEKCETLLGSEQNAFNDECLPYRDGLQKSNHLVGGEARQSARIPAILRCKNGLARQKLRAALHAAEFAVWQASGGDFLRSGLAKGS